MTQFGSMTATMDIGSRLCRLPLVLLVTVSLLFSLLQCATCDLDFAKTDGAITVASIDQNSTPETPEHLLALPSLPFSRHRSAIERVCGADRSHSGCTIISPRAIQRLVFRPSALQATPRLISRPFGPFAAAVALSNAAACNAFKNDLANYGPQRPLRDRLK